MPSDAVTLIVVAQVEAFSPTILVPLTLHFALEAVATTTEILLPAPTVRPAAPAALTNVIAAPRFTLGVPVMFNVSFILVALAPFDVTFTVTLHLPGAIPNNLVPDTLQINFDAAETVPVTLAPAATFKPAFFASVDSMLALPFTTLGVFFTAVVPDPPPALGVTEPRNAPPPVPAIILAEIAILRTP